MGKADIGHLTQSLRTHTIGERLCRELCVISPGSPITSMLQRGWFFSPSFFKMRCSDVRTWLTLVIWICTWILRMHYLRLRRRRPCPPGWTILSCRQRPSEVSKTKMGEGEKLIKMCMTWWFLCCLYMNRCYEKRSKTQFVDRHIDTYHPCQANVHADTYSAHHLIPWKSRKAFLW